MGRYHTKQQTLILEYLALKRIPHLPQSRSGADCWGGGKVGRATVYRALDRLVEAGTILKIPSGDGNRALYRYMGKQPSPPAGGWSAWTADGHFLWSAPI